MFASSSRAPTAMMLRSPCHATCVVRPSFARASIIFAPTLTAPGTLRRCDSKITNYLFSRSCRHRGRQELGLRRYRHLKVRHRGRRVPLQPSALIQYMPRCHRSHSRNPSSSSLIDADLLRAGRSYRWPSLAESWVGHAHKKNKYLSCACRLKQSQHVYYCNNMVFVR